jgi:hypothetical protein
VEGGERGVVGILEEVEEEIMVLLVEEGKVEAIKDEVEEDLLEWVEGEHLEDMSQEEEVGPINPRVLGEGVRPWVPSSTIWPPKAETIIKVEEVNLNKGQGGIKEQEDGTKVPAIKLPKLEDDPILEALPTTLEPEGMGHLVEETKAITTQTHRHQTHRHQ